MNNQFDASALIKSLNLQEPADFSTIVCYAIDSAIGDDEGFVGISCKKYQAQIEFIETYAPAQKLEIASILLQSLQEHYIGSQTAQLSLLAN